MISLDPVPGSAIPRFSLGEIIITPGAATKIESSDIKSALRRHKCGDWGELEPEDRRLNDERVEKGGPLASIYQDLKGEKFYILTEADRLVTTILLPEEY